LAGRDEDRLRISTTPFEIQGSAPSLPRLAAGLVPHDRTTDTIALDQIERILI